LKYLYIIFFCLFRLCCQFSFFRYSLLLSFFVLPIFVFPLFFPFIFETWHSLVYLHHCVRFSIFDCHCFWDLWCHHACIKTHPWIFSFRRIHIYLFQHKVVDLFIRSFVALINLYLHNTILLARKRVCSHEIMLFELMQFMRNAMRCDAHKHEAKQRWILFCLTIMLTIMHEVIHLCKNGC
jgi:hypothetical protein